VARGVFLSDFREKKFDPLAPSGFFIFASLLFFVLRIVSFDF
jgi:hypothetical protein